MKISIPSIPTLADFPPAIRQIANAVDKMATDLMNFSSNGIILRDNLSFQEIAFTNQEKTDTWVKRSHSLKRSPLGTLYRSGDISAVSGIQFTERDVSVRLKANSTVTFILM